MDRRAHERALDDGSPLQGPRQLVAFELLEPRPDPDVHGRRVLRLDPADALERAGERRAGALEKELARQQGAVQLALREDALGDHSRRRSSSTVSPTASRLARETA